MTKKQFFAILCCIAFIILSFADINNFVDSSWRGLTLFARNVLPVLFPFFFISSLLVELSFFTLISNPFTKVMNGLYKVPGASAPVFLVSLLSGYPTGARMLSELYNRGEITRTDAIKTVTFTSTCSPVFIIATLGACLYKNTFIGIFIFTAHSAAAILNGILYRNIKFENDITSQIRLIQPLKRDSQLSEVGSRSLRQDIDLPAAISNSLYSAIQNILAIGGLITLFFIITNQVVTIFSLPPAIDLVFSGILEMTNGVFRASAAVPALLSSSVSIVISCAIVSFGGLCVAMQGFVFLKSFRMPFGFYLLSKITHTIIAVLICLIFVLI